MFNIWLVYWIEWHFMSYLDIYCRIYFSHDKNIGTMKKVYIGPIWTTTSFWSFNVEYKFYVRICQESSKKINTWVKIIDKGQDSTLEDKDVACTQVDKDLASTIDQCRQSPICLKIFEYACWDKLCVKSLNYLQCGQSTSNKFR